MNKENIKALIKETYKSLKAEEGRVLSDLWLNDNVFGDLSKNVEGKNLIKESMVELIDEGFITEGENGLGLYSIILTKKGFEEIK